MPEGPEVETVRRSLEPLLVGRTFGKPSVSKKALRTPTSSKKLAPLEGATVRALGRHGKLMWIDVGARGLMVRLGMSGRMIVAASLDEKIAPHTHVRVPLDDGRELRYVDARRFGEVTYYGADTELVEERDRMGPDALTLDDVTRAIAIERLRATDRTLKDALLDQSVLAGVGNIYAAEALFVARLSPFLKGSKLNDDRARALVRAVEEVLAQAVTRRGTSFSNYVDAMGIEGDNLAHVWVFQREDEPCRVCATKIARKVQGARSTFFCKKCQR